MEIAFSNKGIIDPRVWSTFGLSAKETDNPIGQFGTGLKYAIAVLLRHGREIRIVAGGNQYDFTTEAASLRGKEYNQVLCNGEPLPFTTELGHHWELWQVYRELYSNMLDEGGKLGDWGEAEDSTVIYAEIGDVDHHSVFLDTEASPVLTRGPYVDVYDRPSEYLFYKGVRVHKMQRQARFTYNLHSKAFSLSEDRELSQVHQANVAIAEALFTTDNKKFLWRWLFDTKDFWEASLDMEWYNTPTPSDRVLDMAREARRAQGRYFHPSIFKLCVKHLGTDADIIEPTTRHMAIIDKARAFLDKMDEPVTFPIYVVEPMGDAMAKADRVERRILISTECLDRGVKYVASTLYEENLHLAKFLNDCTYEMQTYLFDKIITLGEQLTGEVL